MRGASALGTLLARYPDADVRVLVIWLPVLPSDTGPPTEALRGALRDPRVTEFWDPGRWASPRMMERARMMVREQGGEPGFPADAIAWDLIGLFPAGGRWEEPFPAPVWHGGPVVDSLESVEQFLREQ